MGESGYFCSDCPRRCRAWRSSDQAGGFCGCTALPQVVRAAPHYGEEPCISGTKGSGTIFFSGCNLRCVFCQNDEISRAPSGRKVSAEELRDIMLKLKDEGVHNINLVTPTHYARTAAKALDGLSLGIPVVWNSSGYESVETLKRLEGLVQIYMPDYKYADVEAARRFSAAPDYPAAAADAIREMGTASQTVPAATAVVSSGPAVEPSQIYAQALQQAVGITTEVTYQNFFGQTSTSAVSGSGFVISEDGYILTNYHVIEYAYEDNLDVVVMTYDGTKYKASIVGVEQSNDVAVLKIDADNLNAVTFGNSDAISVGETVYAVGNPLGELEFSMSTGHVSALDRVISTEESESINMFQIDAAVNSGNSGGPVYNAQGQVIGIVTAKYSSTGVEGLGFAIPINDAANIANDLITKGYVTGKAYMGVRLDERYNSMYAQYYNMPLGAYIAAVESGSCAERAGLQPGDIITRVGDSTVESYSDLRQAIKAYSAGDTAELEVYRADRSMTVTVVFDEARPSN